MNPALNTALTFAKSNIRVFPLKNNSKSEQVLHSWKEEASCSKFQINGWFIGRNYNVGICTGSGLIVIDVDCKHSREGIDLIKQYADQFPKTLVVQTPSGGYHLYYKVDREIGNRVGLYEEIDIRGENGYVVGAGSTIGEREYKVIRDYTIAEANEAVYSFLEGPKQKSRQDIYSFEKIAQGKRNDTLFHLACFLQKRGLADQSIRDAISRENEIKCDPPLSSKELDTLISSALKYNKGTYETGSEITYGGRFTAADLLSGPISETQDIVEGLVSVGVTLLGAPQKSGKTFFCIQMADALSSGKEFLGKKVVQGTVLYLALEDHKTKLQKRLKAMGIEPKNNLIIDILKPDPFFDLETRIKEELEKNPDLKLVVIDTFAKIRSHDDRDYETEYAEVTRYHSLAFRFNLAIILVTHLRKEINPDQPFDAIYGSRGLTAGADTILVMYKRNYLSNCRQLYVQGKDIPDDELTIYQNDHFLFEVTENDYDEMIDENLIRVINYIVANKTYEGSHDALCSKLSLPLRGKGLQVLLTKNKDLLSDTNIQYEILPRTNKARQMKLVYFGDESV